LSFISCFYHLRRRVILHIWKHWIYTNIIDRNTIYKEMSKLPFYFVSKASALKDLTFTIIH
jgi:hypothetical protein